MLYYDVVFDTKVLGLGLNTTTTKKMKMNKCTDCCDRVCRKCGGCDGSINRNTNLNALFGVANVTNDEHKSKINPGNILISVGNTQLIDNVSSMEDVSQIFTPYPTRPLIARFARRIRK